MPTVQAFWKTTWKTYDGDMNQNLMKILLSNVWNQNNFFLFLVQTGSGVTTNCFTSSRLSFISLDFCQNNRTDPTILRQANLKMSPIKQANCSQKHQLVEIMFVKVKHSFQFTTRCYVQLLIRIRTLKILQIPFMAQIIVIHQWQRLI